MASLAEILERYGLLCRVDNYEQYGLLCRVDNYEKNIQQPPLNTIAHITRETSVTVNQIMLRVVQLFAANAAADASAASFAESVQDVRGVVLFNASLAAQLERAARHAAQHALDKSDVQAERFANREEAAYNEAKSLLVEILQSFDAFDAALKVVSQVAAPTDVSVASVGAAEIKLAALQVAEDVLTAWKSAALSADNARKEADPVWDSQQAWQSDLFSEMVSRLDKDLTWKAARNEALTRKAARYKTLDELIEEACRIEEARSDRNNWQH